jgi:hypothetical protein
MSRLSGPLRESVTLPPLPKPERVEIRQVWRSPWLQGRPLVVIAIENARGCSTNTFQQIVPWAVFRKGKRQEASDMLEGNWEFLGTLAEPTNVPERRKYFIHKGSRSPEQPYCGPSCGRAGIEPGKWYETEAEALVDVAKLDEVNGVGWVVAQAAEGQTLKP